MKTAAAAVVEFGRCRRLCRWTEWRLAAPTLWTPGICRSTTIAATALGEAGILITKR